MLKNGLFFNPFGKMLICRLFCTCWFYSLDSYFFLEYRKRRFTGLYCQKEKHGKMANFWPKAWTNPFWKNVNFLDFGTSCFYSLERCFFVLDYRKTRHYGRHNVIYGKRWYSHDNSLGAAVPGTANPAN